MNTNEAAARPPAPQVYVAARLSSVSSANMSGSVVCPVRGKDILTARDEGDQLIVNVRFWFTECYLA